MEAKYGVVGLKPLRWYYRVQTWNMMDGRTKKNKTGKTRLGQPGVQHLQQNMLSHGSLKLMMHAKSGI